jgi:hypothetical protein
MDLKESHFSYHAVLKREQDIRFEGLTLFPAMNEISFQSKIFHGYAECVKSCKGMMEDISFEINLGQQEPKFKVGSEVNPEHSGTTTISTDWAEDEVARFWVYDRSMEGNGKIHAIARGSVSAVFKTEPSFYLN